MSKKELLAGARQFVEQAFAHVDGRMPSKKDINRAAQKIASALRPSVESNAPRRKARALGYFL